MGLLCRHILVIFHAKNVAEIPDMYILKRWTKDANKGVVFIEDGPKSSSTGNSSTLQSLHVHKQASLLPDLAAKSEKIYKLISSDLEETYKKALIMEAELDNESDIIPPDASCQNLIHEQPSESSEPIIRDPLPSQTKGRKKDSIKETQNGRIKSSLELSVNRTTVKRKSCQVCGLHGHNKRSCKEKDK
ncbi:FAR1-related sequence protein, putative, partial [Medicago truncatula]